jgi:hypothetical protein
VARTIGGPRATGSPPHRAHRVGRGGLAAPSAGAVRSDCG